MNKDLIENGIFTKANAVYWFQMPEIKDEIIIYVIYVKEIKKRLSKYGQVFNAGIVYSVEKAKKAEINFISNIVQTLNQIRNVPGQTPTKEFKSHATEGKINLENIKSLIPLKKLLKPSDIANTILFLASDNARFISGTIIPYCWRMVG
jgi:hypothetical protein